MCIHFMDRSDCDICDSLCHHWIGTREESHTGVCTKTDTTTDCGGCLEECTFPEELVEMMAEAPKATLNLEPGWSDRCLTCRSESEYTCGQSKSPLFNQKLTISQLKTTTCQFWRYKF